MASVHSLPVSVLTFTPEIKDTLNGLALGRIFGRRKTDTGRLADYVVLNSVVTEAGSEWSQVLSGQFVRVPCFCYARKHNSPVGIGAELALLFLSRLYELTESLDVTPSRIVMVTSDRFVKARHEGVELSGVLIGLAAEVLR